MFILLTKHDNRALNPYFRRLAQKGYDFFLPLTYEALCYMNATPALPVIFTEPERLSEREARAARALFAAAKAGPSGTNTLNDPGWTMGRYELLRMLYGAGRNGFNVHLATDSLDRIRFPVFLRRTCRHAPILSGLLEDHGALRAAIEGLVAQGVGRADLLIVEYLEYGCDGRFTKYAAFRIGDQIIPAMRMVGPHWEVRDLTQPRPAEEIAREAAYIAENPHRDALMQLTDLAHVTYGRIDYTILDGQPQLFEINTNPTAPPPDQRAAFFAALAQQDDSADGRRRKFCDGAGGWGAFGRTALENSFFLCSQMLRPFGPGLSRHGDRALFALEQRIISGGEALRDRLLRRGP